VKQTLWTLATLLSHWRRHPANLATLLVGLAIATALWSGVQALNDHARKSYASAAAAVSGADARGLVAARGGLFAQDLYIKLRLAGWKVSPVLEGTLRIGDKTLRVIGVEPLTLPRGARLAILREGEGIADFLKPPGLGFATPETLVEIGEGAKTERGRPLPPLQALDAAPAGAVIVDMGVAQTLLDRPGRLSRLMLETKGAQPLASVVGDALRLVEADEGSDLERLTGSFHLNLTAFGLLSFLVGLFIVHASFGLAFEQRLPTIRTLRAVGVSSRALIAAMACEVFTLASLAGGAGVAIGYEIARALLPNVAASLDSLYGAQLPERLTLDAGWALSGLAMALIGASSAAAGGLVRTLRLPVLSAARPQAWREAHRRYLRRQALLAGLAVAVAVAAFIWGGGLVAGFVLIGGGLFGAALALPVALAGALAVGARAAKRRNLGPVTSWFWADSRQQLPGLSLALMALLLALSTNIGVGAMVEGFRMSFTRWLDDRLIAEVYFEARDDAAGQEIEAWLARRPEIEAILPVFRTKTQIAHWPVEVLSLRAHKTYSEHFPLLERSADAFARLARGDAVLVSEQLARRLKLAVGEALDIPTEGDIWTARIAGIYPDYGNPNGQLRAGVEAFERHWPQAPRTNYSLRVAPASVAALIRDLQAEMGPQLVRIVDQAFVKNLSLRIFERTFAVTAALNTLTLIVSAVALLASLLTLGNLRLAQLAPLWAMGVTRKRLAELELARVVLFAAGTALFALPLGLFMAWCLVAVVNVEAFGWRLPFHVFPGQWAQVFAIALLTAFLAALAPTLRLARAAPADLLKVFANES